jgi:hypothetical protein
LKPTGHPAGKTYATPGIAPVGGFGGLGEDPSRGVWHTATGEQRGAPPLSSIARSDRDSNRTPRRKRPADTTNETESRGHPDPRPLIPDPSPHRRAPSRACRGLPQFLHPPPPHSPFIRAHSLAPSPALRQGRPLALPRPATRRPIPCPHPDLLQDRTLRRQTCYKTAPSTPVVSLSSSQPIGTGDRANVSDFSTTSNAARGLPRADAFARSRASRGGSASSSPTL